MWRVLRLISEHLSIKTFALSLLVLILGCSVFGKVDYQIPISQVVQDPQSFKGKELLWGGTVAEVVREEKEVFILIDKKPLDEKGKPNKVKIMEGRFLVQCSKDLKAGKGWIGKEITVLGRFKGEFIAYRINREQRFPVFTCIAVYLWAGDSAKVWSHYYREQFPPFLDNPGFVFNGSGASY